VAIEQPDHLRGPPRPLTMNGYPTKSRPLASRQLFRWFVCSLDKFSFELLGDLGMSKVTSDVIAIVLNRVDRLDAAVLKSAIGPKRISLVHRTCPFSEVKRTPLFAVQNIRF
jgi:hypothetical protein